VKIKFCVSSFSLLPWQKQTKNDDDSNFSGDHLLTGNHFCLLEFFNASSMFGELVATT